MIQDGMPHGSGGGDLSGYAARVDALERKIMKARYKRMQVFKEIRDHIERLEDENEKDVLVYRYVRNMKWEDIAVKMGYRWAQIHRIHARALKNLKVEIE
ncbi:sigma factor-like helix-turn-helix DNA-binding protein [Blautia hydrogenotrophica]|uniref:sigma factor-like helix-turn-helix DNA-binding protein n=1 Tax=Blautia hydrogenotrophica TaxID=53443 RepID=UPI003AB4EF2D